MVKQPSAAIRELQPDVAVLDMAMPELDGMQVLQAVEREGLATRVVFLSASAGGPVVYEALGAGAAAYLSKNAPAEEIRNAVLTVGRGGTVIPAQAHEGIAAEIRVRAAEARPLLTEREQQILSLAADGHSVTDMATRLHVSHGTVKSHLQNLYQKLGVSDRTAAVAEALRRELIQ